MRILQTSNLREIKKIMQGIGVDPYGIELMLPKAIPYLIKISSLSPIQANILKQEMLALGADAAVSRDTLKAKAKKTDCLIMGSLSQYEQLNKRLKRQPLGLDVLAGEFSNAIANYQKDKFLLRLSEFRLNIKEGRTHIMGILNLTPDSFSGDGMYRSTVSARSRGGISSNCKQFGGHSPQSTVGRIIDYAEKMVIDGASMIDAGGESTRPGSKPVSVKEELARVVPALKALVKRIKVPVSIDTYKPLVASAALDCGVSIVNDITGLRNPKMLKVISRYKCAVIIMHLKGGIENMQDNPRYVSLLDEVIDYLKDAINRAKAAGVSKESIIIDPGIGFGKTLEQNLTILKNLKEFKVLGMPLLVGTSRKSFIGKILNVLSQERLYGTLASCIACVNNGANLLRVHDVKAVKQAIEVMDAIKNC